MCQRNGIHYIEGLRGLLEYSPFIHDAHIITVTNRATLLGKYTLFFYKKHFYKKHRPILPETLRNI